MNCRAGLMQIQPTLLDQLIKLRRNLHRHAELSNRESKTAAIIVDFLQENGRPDSLHTGFGGQGIVCVYKGQAGGAALAFRCELDALPIPEVNQLAHRSLSDAVSHKCGHDGHMAILCGVAAVLAKHRPAGDVYLIFQPAEETGEGAQRMLRDPRFGKLKPDFVFALHNLPGYPLHEIVLRPGVFSCASAGLAARLAGRTAHAAQPESGVSPGPALAEILRTLYDLPHLPDDSPEFALVTVVHARLGEIAFGAAPGEAVVMATLRAYNDGRLQELRAHLRQQIEKIAGRYSLTCDMSWLEVFAATVNDRTAVEMIGQAADECGLKVARRSHPFRWSEDFGQFTRCFKGALFGLGAGENHPDLHCGDYDFPDALLESGIRLFTRLLQQQERLRAKF